MTIYIPSWFQYFFYTAFNDIDWYNEFLDKDYNFELDNYDHDYILFA